MNSKMETLLVILFAVYLVENLDLVYDLKSATAVPFAGDSMTMTADALSIFVIGPTANGFTRYSRNPITHALTNTSTNNIASGVIYSLDVNPSGQKLAIYDSFDLEIFINLDPTPQFFDFYEQSRTSFARGILSNDTNLICDVAEENRVVIHEFNPILDQYQQFKNLTPSSNGFYRDCRISKSKEFIVFGGKDLDSFTSTFYPRFFIYQILPNRSFFKFQDIDLRSQTTESIREFELSADANTLLVKTTNEVFLYLRNNNADHFNRRQTIPCLSGVNSGSRKMLLTQNQKTLFLACDQESQIRILNLQSDDLYHFNGDKISDTSKAMAISANGSFVMSRSQISATSTTDLKVFKLNCAATFGPTCLLCCPTKCHCDQNNGLFLNSQSECENCHTSCATCNGPNPDNCLSCPMDYGIDYSNSCVYTGVCHLSCATCSGRNDNQCITCIGGLTLISSNNSCALVCDSTCRTCTGPNSNQCLSCSEQLTLTTNNKCLLVCHQSCNQCYGPYNNNCSSCRNGMVLTQRFTCEEVRIALPIQPESQNSSNLGLIVGLSVGLPLGFLLLGGIIMYALCRKNLNSLAQQPGKSPVEIIESVQNMDSVERMNGQEEIIGQNSVNNPEAVIIYNPALKQDRLGERKAILSKMKQAPNKLKEVPASFMRI